MCSFFFCSLHLSAAQRRNLSHIRVISSFHLGMSETVWVKSRTRKVIHNLNIKSFIQFSLMKLRSFVRDIHRIIVTSNIKVKIKSKLHSPPLKNAWITLLSHLMLKYTLPSPLIQSILENISLHSLERSLNYIFLLFYVKISVLVPQYFFFISNNLTHLKEK